MAEPSRTLLLGTPAEVSRPATLEPEAGAIVGGKLQLVSEIGRGAMGSVWKATDLRLGRPVAVKLIRPELVAEGAPGASLIATRFEREAQAVAQLRTRHVAQVHELGMEKGTPYLVMELLVGESLSKRLGRLGKLSVEEALKIGAQTCRGLARAHEAGIIHRDLKPANLFIARSDGEEVVKVLDFGIAKIEPRVVGGDATAEHEVVGSPHYMSPEQLQGPGMDARADLWSLGVILFRCLSGKRPFTGDSVDEVAVQICSGEPRRLSSVLPGASPELEAFFARAFARKLQDRFASATEMGAVLQVLAATPAEAPAGTPPAPPVGPALVAAAAHDDDASEGKGSAYARAATLLSRRARARIAGDLGGGGEPSRRLVAGSIALGMAVGIAVIVLGVRGSNGPAPTAEPAASAPVAPASAELAPGAMAARAAPPGDVGAATAVPIETATASPAPGPSASGGEVAATAASAGPVAMAPVEVVTAEPVASTAPVQPRPKASSPYRRGKTKLKGVGLPGDRR